MDNIEKLFEKKRSLYIVYSFVFVCMCLIVFSYYFLNDKTLIFYGDSWFQHYKALCYYSGYLKSTFRNLLLNHRLEIPMWDFSIGEGSDVLSALHYYCIGDPIAFLSVLVPEEYLYAFFDFSAILRMYLSGLVFIRLCEYTGKKDSFAVLSGSMIYVFCYWNLLNAVKHIFFLNPMIYLPLVILGVEKVIREEKIGLLCISVALCSLCNFYFLYMIALLTVIYVAVRLLTLYGKNFGNIIRKLAYMIYASIMGFLISAVISFPIIYDMLTNSRIGIDYGLHVVYPFFYYDRLITILLTTDNYFWLCMGFSSPVVLSTLLAFRQFKKDRLIFALNLIALILILFPVFGKILNGFSYVSNRWSFALALLAAYTFVSKWNEFENNKVFLCILTLVFSLFSFVTAWWRTVKIVPILICLLFLSVVLFWPKKKPLYVKQAVLLVLVLLSIIYTADYSNSSRGRNRASGALTVEDAKNVAVSTEAHAMKEYLEEKNISGFVRYSGGDLTDNAAMLSNVYSTNYYFSIANPSVSAYRSDLGINEYPAHWYNGYDNRSLLYSLANVSYYIVPSSYEGMLPYGFSEVDGPDGYRLYRNDCALPFGYTYGSDLSYDAWKELSQVEKEEALLHRIVVEGAQEEQIDLLSDELDYIIVPDENIEISDNGFLVKEGGASLKLQFNGLGNCFNYISFDNLDYDAQEEYFFGDEMTDTVMSFLASDGVENRIEYHNRDYQFYNGKHDFSAFLGFSEKALNSIQITFNREGLYSFDRMYVSCTPSSQYKEGIRELKEDYLQDLVIGNNFFSGTIRLKSDKYLLLSVPYSEGWTALVDGKKAKLLKGNGCYCALKLSEGFHEIKMTYRTPYLRQGARFSAAALLAYVFSVLRVERKKRGRR